MATRRQISTAIRPIFENKPFYDPSPLLYTTIPAFSPPYTFKSATHRATSTWRPPRSASHLRNRDHPVANLSMAETTKKRRKINPFAGGPGSSQYASQAGAGTQGQIDDSGFKPGNLILLRVWNFTTYSYGEFRLSPSLNMIIGPNGTGKSTFVAAVCLGLGGKIDLIKRKSMDSMIKSGETEARIEITIKNEGNTPNTVIERKFAMKVSRSVWKVDGAPAEYKSVCSIVRRLNIQLDNLCHFLPQERVAEFATLSPEKLLLETERTIGDNSLLDCHNQLVELDTSWVDLTTNVQILEEQIANIKVDVEKFELEAQKFQEFEDKVVQIDRHKKVLPYAKLQDLKEKMKHLKNERERAKRALQEFSGNAAPLKNMVRRVEHDMQSAKESYDETKENLAGIRAELEKHTKKAEGVASTFSAAQNDVDSLKSRTEVQKKELEQSITEKGELARRLQTMESFDMSKMPELAAQRQQKHAEKTQIEEDFDTVKMKYDRIKRDLHVGELSYREERKKLESNDRLEILRTRGSRYRKELMDNAYEAHSILRKERTPDMRYYEAPVVCCGVTDRRYAKYFEKVIDNNSLLAFYFDTEAQYKAVFRALPPGVNVPGRVVSSPHVGPPMPTEQLRKLGFDGYLSEFLTGPESVIMGLNSRSFLHCIPVSLGPVAPEVMQKLLQPVNGAPPFRRFIVGDDLFVISRSKYGSRQVFYSTERIQDAQLMGAEGLSEDVRREIQQRLVQKRETLTEMQEKMSALEADKARFQDQVSQVDDDMQQLEQEVRALRRKQEIKSKMEGNITHVEERIQRLTRSITQDHSEQIRAKENELVALFVKHSGAMARVAKIHQKMVSETVSLKKAELLVLQFENKLLCFASLLAELEERQTRLKEVYLQAKAKCDEYKRGDAAEEVRSLELTGEERDAVTRLVKLYLDAGNLSESFVVRKIEQLEEDLGVLVNVDRGSLELLKTKKAELEAAEAKLPHLTNQRDAAKAKIDEIFIPWERELSSMVEQISKAFQKRFVTVASDGQVELVKSARFKEWKLEILVKFRENAELKVLDHQSQSGGERAVSTIFFIMSLQGLTKAPIRIVDEINQGMDPKNEKMAHKYLVDTACKNGQSQYFLVTPKLLTGLYYHPAMTIHCIFTGPHLQKNGPGGDGLLNFKQLAAGVR